MNRCVYCGIDIPFHQPNRRILLQGVGPQLFCRPCEHKLLAEKQLIRCKPPQRTYVSIHRTKGRRHIYKDWKECKADMRYYCGTDVEFGYFLRRPEALPSWYQDAFMRKGKCGGMDDSDLPAFWEHWCSKRVPESTYTLTVVWGKDWPYIVRDMPLLKQRGHLFLHTDRIYVQGDSLEALNQALTEKALLQNAVGLPFLLLLPDEKPYKEGLPSTQQEFQEFAHPEMASDLTMVSHWSEPVLRGQEWRATPQLLETLHS